MKFANRYLVACLAVANFREAHRVINVRRCLSIHKIHQFGGVLTWVSDVSVCSEIDTIAPQVAVHGHRYHLEVSFWPSSMSQRVQLDGHIHNGAADVKLSSPISPSTVSHNFSTQKLAI